jgi:spiro-SPASM protein
MSGMTNNSNTRGVLEAFQGGKSGGGFMPSYYGIEVTRHCNLACIMCPHPTFPSGSKGHMSHAVFERIISEIAPYAEIIKLHWVGEPLLHPNIIEMIRHARDNTDADLYMSTNATLLKGKLAEQLLTAGLTKLIISIDGNSPETYESIRKKADFDEVISNVEAFLNRVQIDGGPLCELQMIQFSRNSSEAKDFVERWRVFSGVAINVTWISDWAGSVPEIRDGNPEQNPVSQESRTPCSDLWFKMQFGWTGEVHMCCFDAHRSETFGDITKTDLNDIWQGPRIQELRRNHLENKFTGICGACKDWAKPQEYEFWYDLSDYKEDPSMIWSAPKLT